MKINANTQYNQQFNGRIGKFKTPGFATKLEDVRSKASLILEQNYNDILSLTKGAGEKRIDFFDSLVQLYTTKYFYNFKNKENSNIVNTIYQNIKKPKNIHINIVKNFKNSLESLNQILIAAGNSTKKLKFAQNINNLIENDENLAAQLLNSKHNRFYVNNFNKIKSYLILNQDNPNSINDLEKMVETNTFNHKTYDKTLKIKNILQDLIYSDIDKSTTELFIKNYSKPRVKLLQTIQDKYTNINSKVDSNDENEILSMYLSTNKNNIKLRNKLIEYFDQNYNFIKSQEENSAYLKNINTIFKIADSGDKHAKNYLKKLTNSKDILFSDPKEVVDILNEVPTKKLDIFFENSKRIIQATKKENRIDELKNNISKLQLPKNNKLALKYGYTTKENIFKKAYLYISNTLNLIRDKLTKDTKPLSLKTNENITTPIKNIEKEIVKTNPIVENLNQVQSNTKSEIKATSQQEKSIINLENKSKEKTINNDKPIKKENVLKKMTSRFEKIQKQDALHQNIISFISKKLGAKTFSNQREKFVENATKMRYEMLPEIFASISDTRKADRAVGKYRINSANKDALNLYLKINGNNKKFVNYLLKKRNVDGSRMFEVKDIISMLDKAEQQIKKQRQNNPEYRARDVRKYYNHLLESKIEQYGKVTRQKSKKTK